MKLCGLISCYLATIKSFKQCCCVLHGTYNRFMQQNGKQNFHFSGPLMTKRKIKTLVVNRTNAGLDLLPSISTNKRCKININSHQYYDWCSNHDRCSSLLKYQQYLRGWLQVSHNPMQINEKKINMPCYAYIVVLVFTTRVIYTQSDFEGDNQPTTVNILKLSHVSLAQSLVSTLVKVTELCDVESWMSSQLCLT